MKIAIVNSFYPPWRGGAETYVYNVAKVLLNRGHKVTVICSSDPLEPGTYIESGIEVKRLRLVGRLYGTPIPIGLRKELCQLDADIFHANFPSPYFAFNVAVASFLRRIPAVLTWHNDLPTVSPGAGVLVELHDRLILPNYVRKYRHIIATSERYAANSRNLLRFQDIVTVIPNGVDCERFNPHVESDDVKERLGLEGKFVILFVAALTKWHRYKGLEILLDALRLVVQTERELLLIVVGDGELRSEFERLSQNLNVRKNVIFAGNVCDEKLPQFYAACDVLVLPSKDMSEGFGLTILEANAAGKPCIGTSVGGIPSVIENKFNGLIVRPNDSSALATAILKLAMNREKCSEMGRNGRRVALLHDWKRITTMIGQLYLKTIHQD